ncbi:STAS domain-containing protein [Aneurinibacillus sp. BA2021]|nr:STAS domain-containing protein [Aneurinibacillus sp. BA2021]
MIKFINEENELTIYFEKDLTLLSLTYDDDFWSRVEQLSGKDIIIDFQHVNFIDSTGIEFLANLVVQLKKKNVIRFYNTSTYIKELIELSELDLL